MEPPTARAPHAKRALLDQYLRHDSHTGVLATRSNHMSIPQMLHFDDVDVYSARNEYWVGRVLDGICGGGSLYLKDRVTDPWVSR